MGLNNYGKRNDCMSSAQIDCRNSDNRTYESKRLRYSYSLEKRLTCHFRESIIHAADTGGGRVDS